MREGFTLAETLIALLLASILLTVSATALMRILRAEGAALRMQQSSLAMQTIGCCTALGEESPREIPQVEAIRHEVKASGAVWTVWDIACTSFPPFSVTLEYPAPQS